MSVNLLFVEGNLESEVLTPIFKGSPVVRQGGSKNSLKPRAATERRENQVNAGYLRDRDFDFDPPTDTTAPTIDGRDKSTPFGWRWCRHEIENYLIEPALVAEVITVPISDFEQVLRDVGTEIRSYQAARWTVGCVRRSLPPHYDLKTRPEGLNEIDLPPDLGEAATHTWASTSVESHRLPITAATDPAAVRASFDQFVGRFDAAFTSDVSNVLLWFSGKDLLAAMRGWLNSVGYANPGEFRAAIRDWIIANPERALELLPEWKALTELVTAES